MIRVVGSWLRIKRIMVGGGGLKEFSRLLPVRFSSPSISRVGDPQYLAFYTEPTSISLSEALVRFRLLSYPSREHGFGVHVLVGVEMPSLLPTMIYDHEY